MLSHRFYYGLKPYVPWRVRMALRRISARRKRERYRDVWPIDESAGRAPENWPGWPEGKRFAIVLTHDVEGPDGLEKCRRLAELEMELGFRSSFNFIPEGPYVVPPSLREWLTSHGFEVGVHDLHHDGKLFSSRAGFNRKAKRINSYVKEWGAAGFRSGFMLRELDWLHELDIRYDCSTFDTDPFEPQPDAVGTIFPFWVPALSNVEGPAPSANCRAGSPNPAAAGDKAAFGDAALHGDPSPQQPYALNLKPKTANAPAPSSLPPAPQAQRPYPLPLTPYPAIPQPRSGYVELPYTLPQDSTLFLLLREKTPEIWLRKLDWIAKHGGMALLNIHPDYLRFAGESTSRRTYSIELYLGLLREISARYSDACWRAPPAGIARYVRETFVAAAPAARRAIVPQPWTAVSPFVNGTRGRILMLVENKYPADTRVRNEANLLTSAGYEVSVVSLGGRKLKRSEMVDGVRVYRLPRVELFNKTVAKPGLFGRLMLSVKSLVGYTVEYFYFTTACLLTSCYVLVRRGFDVIHTHNPPDTLFLVALPFKLLGKKYVFDHHDLCPELYRSRYNCGETLVTRVLRATEWCSLKLANVTIATNESYKRVQTERGGRNPRDIFIVRNGPNKLRMTQIPPSPRLRSLNKCIFVYIGSLNPQDGVDYLLRSLRHLKDDLRRTDFHCVIMGTGDSLEDLRALARELKLDGNVELTGFVSDEDLQANLAAADICMDPDPSSPLNDVSTWIKIMEYMAYAKPIVSFDLTETRFSAQDAAVFVRPNDETEFARAVARLMDAPDERRRMGEFGRQRVEKDLQWSVVGENLLAAYGRLLGAKRAGEPVVVAKQAGGATLTQR